MGINRYATPARLWLTGALSLLAQGAAAQTLTCAGTDPDWSLDLMPEAATFAFLDRATTLDIPQRTTAEGADWPRAFTLVGPRDSAILLLDQDSGQIMAHVLTQRGETPILLTGRCEPPK